MPSILIAEDHEPTRHLRGRILRDAGFTTIERDTASATVEAVLERAKGLELILLDVGLPDGHGFDVCQRIKAISPDLPVVLISAVYRTAHARRDGLAAGADAYLVEPAAETRLVRTVQALLTPTASAQALRAVVRTMPNGIILAVNEAAAKMLNVGGRALPGRSLLVFFDRERPRVQREAARAVSGQVCNFDAVIRPKERRPFCARVDLATAVDGSGDELEWIIETSQENRRDGAEQEGTEFGGES